MNKYILNASWLPRVTPGPNPGIREQEGTFTDIQGPKTQGHHVQNLNDNDGEDDVSIILASMSFLVCYLAETVVDALSLGNLTL